MTDLERQLREQFSPLAGRLAASYRHVMEQGFKRFATVAPEHRQAIIMGRVPSGMSGLEACGLHDSYRRCRRYVSFEGGRMSGTPFLSGDFLAREAAVYGEEQANAFLGKLLRKLEGATDPHLVFESGSGANFRLVLKAGDSHVAVEQQAVMKFNKSGQPFHQFPARIYLDNRFMSEAAFRAHMEKRAAHPPAPPEADDDGMELS